MSEIKPIASNNNSMIVAIERFDTYKKYCRQVYNFKDVVSMDFPDIYFELVNWTMYCMTLRGER